MARHFDSDLNEFHNQLLRMAALTEQAIDKSVEAIKKQDKNLAQQCIAEDKQIDELENQLLEASLDLLARYQPMAIDLRYITTGRTIALELERIADLSVNIAYRAIELAAQPLVKPLIDTPRLVEVAKRMVKNAIDSFVNRDTALARNVILSDSESDQLRNKIIKELICDYMSKDAAIVPRAIPLLLVARDLERICDHAAAIAEDVIYMIQAKVVKHHPERLNNGNAEPSPQ